MSGVRYVGWMVSRSTGVPVDRHGTEPPTVQYYPTQGTMLNRQDTAIS